MHTHRKEIGSTKVKIHDVIFRIEFPQNNLKIHSFEFEIFYRFIDLNFLFELFVCFPYEMLKKVKVFSQKCDRIVPAACCNYSEQT